MRARNTLRLPSAKDLKSNKIEELQDYFELILNELDKSYRLLWQDLATIQVDTDGFIYFGNKDTDGSWRVGRIGADWVLEHRASGTWTTVELSSGS